MRTNTLRGSSLSSASYRNPSRRKRWSYLLWRLINYASAYYIRVATAQGKQGIWLLTFPDRENTGNLVNLIFYTGKIVPTQGKF